ncbi:hypothetical protein AB0F88_39680 [Streptosporangium sp. NPDC023963]|uniref:hypothetical protein n=1 Tax=Streptosporangium sp. NPDC023963 TaxID=3155608 RepID=UPI003434E201
MNTRDDWIRVGDAVRRRRADKDWTQMYVATQGPLSIDRVQAIEGARSTRYSPRTIANLERALEWEPGSVRAILQGREPTPLGEPAVSQPPVAAEAKAPAADEGDEDEIDLDTFVPQTDSERMLFNLLRATQRSIELSLDRRLEEFNGKLDRIARRDDGDNQERRPA